MSPDFVEVIAHDPPHAGSPRGPGGEGLVGENDAGKRLSFTDNANVPEKQVVQAVERVGGFFSGRVDIRPQLCVQQVEDRVEHGVLAGEMPVNARGHQAHPPGHGGDTQPFNALAGHQLQRGCGDLFAANASLQFGVGHRAPRCVGSPPEFRKILYCDYTFTIGGNPQPELRRKRGERQKSSALQGDIKA